MVPGGCVGKLAPLGQRVRLRFNHGSVLELCVDDHALIAVAFKFIEALPVLREIRGGEDESVDDIRRLTVAGRDNRRIAQLGAPSLIDESPLHGSRFPGAGDIRENVFIRSARGEGAVYEQSIDHIGAVLSEAWTIATGKPRLPRRLASKRPQSMAKPGPDRLERFDRHVLDHRRDACVVPMPEHYVLTRDRM